VKFIFALIIGAALCAPAMDPRAAPAAPARIRTSAPNPGVPLKVAAVEGITEYRLGNGMRVLLFPDASKPTVTTNMVYMVGSRHENYGETGMAHLLEHLLFKPSANFGKRKGSPTPVEVLNASGAQFNGTTWFDRTNYFATFPANDDNLGQILALEADRMVNAAIDQNDLWNSKTGQGEMTVVRNEFEMGQNDPIEVTSERIRSVAFDWHNYGKATIGARSDIEQVDIARLKAFYRTYYQPDNAMLMVAGRFDQAKVLGQVNRLFGRIPRPARVLPATYTAEPTQDGERAVTVRRSGGAQFVGAGYHVAPSAHPDAVALAVLGRILVDAPGGRLHKALVETKLATRLDYDAVSNFDPGYRIFGAVVPKDGKLELTEAAMLGVLEGMKAAPVTAAEVARAKQQLNKSIELASADTARLTVALTESMAAGDWRLFFVQRDILQKIDAAAVQAVAEKYLKASNRTVGRFTPTDLPDRTEVPARGDVAAMVGDYKGRAVLAPGEAFDPNPNNVEARTERFTLPGGLKGALLPKKTKGGMVSVALALRMGTEDSLRGKAEIGSYAAGMLMRGTETLTRQEMVDKFDQLNARVGIAGNAEGVTATVTSSAANLAPALELLAQVLKRPAFSPVEFAQFQRERVNRAEQNLPEPQALASNALMRLIDATPEGHVRHVATLPEQLAALKRITAEDAKIFHAAFYGADHASMAAVGQFDPAALKAQLASLFGAWQARQPYVRIADTIKPVAGARLALATPDKASSMLLAVTPVTITDEAPAYPALLMANHMLGGGALRSRLADRIRQKEGLSYGVGSSFSAPPKEPAGMWLAYAISAPQNTARVEAALRDELDKVLRDGFTEVELAAAKKGWKQSEEVERTEDGPLARRLAAYLKLERTMAYDQDLEAKVAALTVAQVNQALRQHLKPVGLSIVSAGDFAKAGKDADKPADREAAVEK
jgi:zinc protease